MLRFNSNLQRTINYGINICGHLIIIIALVLRLPRITTPLLEIMPVQARCHSPNTQREVRILDERHSKLGDRNEQRPIAVD